MTRQMAMPSPEEAREEGKGSSCEDILSGSVIVPVYAMPRLLVLEGHPMIRKTVLGLHVHCNDEDSVRPATAASEAVVAALLIFKPPVAAGAKDFIKYC